MQGTTTINEARLVKQKKNSEKEFNRIVLHEFGHALGFIHEHQNPEGNIKWNIPAVYKHYTSEPYYWKIEDINKNILEKYSSNQLNATKFDPYSIMVYAIPDNLAFGISTPSNTTLSELDKTHVSKLYPQR